MVSERSASPVARASLRAGAVDVAPVLIGIIPFGLVAGVAAVEAGLGLREAIGFSTGVFAGAAQLAAIDLLGAGAPAGVAILTAVVINLRMAMYSASLATFLSREPVGRRAIAAYLLTDQAYALSVTRYRDEARPAVQRWWYYLGAALLLWTVWQMMTVIGVVVGDAVPEGVPLGFAVPLVFLALLVPTLTDRAAVVAAVVGGTVAVTADPLPANLGMPLGALSGVAAGYLAYRRGRYS